MSDDPSQDVPSIGLMLPVICRDGAGVLDAARLLRIAMRAEEQGFDSLNLGDHLLHPRPILEALVSLAAIAARTNHIVLGPCMLLAALREPLWLASQLGTLAAFAPGRLRLGIGVGGEYPGEWEAAGVALPERGQRTEQVLDRIRDVFEHAPTWPHQTTDLPLRLGPCPPAAPPLVFGGWKDVALRRAARMGDGWFGYLLAPDSFARRAGKIATERRRLGRSGAFTFGMVLPVHICDHRSEARAAAQVWTHMIGMAQPLPEHLFLAGSADDILDQVSTYLALGCREVVLAPVDQGEKCEKQIDTLAEHVMPHLRRMSCTEVRVAA